MHTEAQSNHVLKTRLPNGLVVIFKEDHSNPVVAINVWFRIGSAHESKTQGGLAHFQEHMVFKGTDKYGVGEIANLVKSAGGNLNAATSYSYTTYYVVLPSRSFRLGLEIQADAMMNSTFDPEEFHKERLVVIEEARMYDDTPDAYSYYRAMELGFAKHNYRRPIAGHEKIVSKFTREQLFEFYRTYYRPGNAILIVVGDVEREMAMREIERVYGSWSGSDVVLPDSPVEPPQRAFRFKLHPGTIDHAYMRFGFHVPGILDPDYPALEVLTTLLGFGKSSRLYRRVREDKRLVTTASAALLAEKWPGYFMVFASTPAAKWEEARDAVFAEIVRFAGEPVGEDELSKARRQVEKAMYNELETVDGQASNLGYYEVLGDYRLAQEHREAIRRVTARDVMSVARKHLKLANCSLIAYLPKDSIVPGVTRESVKTVLHGVAGGQSKQRVPRGRKGLRTSVGRQVATAVAATPVAGVETGEMSCATLANGVRVLCKRRATVPLVSVLTVCQGGTRSDPKGKAGLSLLSSRSLLKGSTGYTAEEIAGMIEGFGGNIESFSGFDISGVSLNVLRDHLDDSLVIYRDVIRHPRFTREIVEEEKKRLLEELAKRHDHPVSYSIDHLFAMTFGDHPYAHPFIGDEPEFSALSEKDCVESHRRVLVPGNIVVAFVGDIEPERALECARKLYADMEPAPLSLSPVGARTEPVRPGVHALAKPKLNQAVGLVGFVAPPMLTREAVGLHVLDGLMTGLGGRLFIELRDKRSLGYMAGSAFLPLKELSLFYGYANPKPEGIDDAIEVILNELVRVTKEPVLDRELHRSKEWLIGTQTMKLQTNLAQATEHGYYEALGFGYETVARLPGMIQQVTKEDILEAAASVFHRDKAVCVKLLPAS
jgi:zinc protease